MAEEYRLSYTGQQVDEAIGKALTGLPTITIAVSQVVSQSPLQIQLTDEQYATMQNHSVVFDVSALNMPAVVANYDKTFPLDGDDILQFIFVYSQGIAYVTFNQIFVNTSTKKASININSTYPANAYRATTAYLADEAKSVEYSTTAPSSANNTGILKIVVLSSEPATRYNGYLYIITGSN